MTAGPTLLAFDFDGTLAPICDDPAKVRMNRRAEALLRECGRARGVAVAITSGRDVHDLAARTGLTSAYFIGSHGLEIHAPGGVVVRDAPPFDVELDGGLFEAIERSGLHLERKKHAVALHWRGRELNGRSPIVASFRTWAVSAGLDLIEGRCVIEARRSGGGKGEALRWLASLIGATRVIYAGDDYTDFGALRFAAERGCGFFIANEEREPPAGVKVVSSFLELYRLVREEVLT